MTAKRPHRISKFNEKTAALLERNEDTLFRNKIESIFHHEDSGITNYNFQNIETGRVTFSATQSATVAKIFVYGQNKERILFAKAQALNLNMEAIVTDVTTSEITIVARPTVVNTACGTYTSFSDVMGTACLTIMFQVIGTNP